ncbi:MAG TPA: zinc ribbon domain-containing protein [Verrucomicrobiae bacterium]|nr:zinc ribbon domain-containing protein [Verrucomicrobiae bacterium]
MPIYEYVCKACGVETEIMHKISDPTPKKCPECGKPKLAKQMSATGFRLGGGGWYETDFKSGNKRNVAEKTSAGEACAPTGCAKPDCGAKVAAKPEKTEKKADKADTKPKPAAKAA